MLSISEDRDLKSRQTLTELLERQIDRNEQLQAQNLELQEQQRRLLAIIQTKMQEISRLQEGKPLSDSTLQVTMRDVSDRTASLEKIVQEKENEIQKLRSYYTNVIEKIEEEHKQKTENTDCYNNKLVSDLKRAREEVNGLQESLLRGNEKVRQLSQELIAYERELEEMRRNQGQTLELKMEILHLNEKIKQDQKSEKEKLLSLQLDYQQKMSKMKWQYEDQMAKIRREGQERFRNFKHQSEQALKKQANEYEQRINFMIIRAEEQKQELRQQLLQQAKGCILSQLQQQQLYNKEKYADMQNQLNDCKQKLDALRLTQQNLKKQKMETQRQIEALLSEKKETQTNLKRFTIQTQESKMTVERLQEKITVNEENIQYLQTKSTKNAQEIAQLQGKLSRASLEAKRIDTAFKKATTEVSQLKKLNLELQDCKISLENELQELKQKTQQLNSKNIREVEKRQKMIGDLRGLAKEQEEQIQELSRHLIEAESQQSNSQVILKQQVQTLTLDISKKHEENAKLLKQNKKIKDQVQKLKQHVKNNFQELGKVNEDLKDSNEQLQGSCQMLAAERDNYRRLYETNVADLNRARDKIYKQEDKLTQMAAQISNSSQEIEYLKEEIARYQLDELEKAELERLKDQTVDLRARLANSADQIQKYKKEGADLARDVLVLHEQNAKLLKDNEKWEQKAAQWNTDKMKMEEQSRLLEAELEQRCKKLESQLPYINTLIQEKKLVQTQLARVSGQLKRKQHLLQTAKRSKAEQLVSLQREGTELKRKENRLEKQLQQLRGTLQQLNREKVGLLRESTEREDVMRRIEKQNRQLKGEIKRLQSTCDQQQHQIDNLYNMLQVYDKEDA